MGPCRIGHFGKIVEHLRQTFTGEETEDSEDKRSDMSWSSVEIRKLTEFERIPEQEGAQLLVCTRSSANTQADSGETLYSLVDEVYSIRRFDHTHRYHIRPRIRLT